MGINWKNPKKELPTDGQMVWVASFHKENFIPDSVEINAGEAEWTPDGKQCAVYNNDAIGCGGQRWVLWEAHDCEYGHGIDKDAWAEAHEINLPSWYPKASLEKEKDERFP